MSRSNCTHSINTSHYVDDSVDDWGTKISGHWVYSTRSTMRDIDLHRFKCTQCGEIGYYSSAARNYHERGVRTSGIKGLE